jgi:hypothetical protein
MISRKNTAALRPREASKPKKVPGGNILEMLGRFRESSMG